MPGQLSRYTYLVLTLLLLSACFSNEPPALFEDVTLTSGLGDYQGMSYGAFWGDYDSDGKPDVYLTNHLQSARLYRNLGGGRFQDVTATVFNTTAPGHDKHGAAWADFNNDGQLDLVQLTGAKVGIGSEPKQLFVNQNNQLLETANAAGVDNIYGRTRMPLWLDVDNNGQLDLFHGAEARFDNRSPPFLFLQNNARFTPLTTGVDFPSRSVPFCILTELNGKAGRELLCRVIDKKQTSHIFDLASLPAQSLTLLPTTAFEDVAAGDFDNDGAIDLFLARKNAGGRISFAQPGSNLIVVDITSRKSDFATPTGFSFNSTGEISFNIKAMQPKNLQAEQISIGSKNLHPASLQFSISDETAGITANLTDKSRPKPNINQAVIITQTAKGHWHVAIAGQFTKAGKSQYQQLTLQISSDNAINNIEPFNNDSRAEEAPARLFMNRGGQLIEESEQRGVNNVVIAASNVVSGDFDNDMDLDLFIVASGGLGKQHNVLLLNDGSGHFKPTPAAGGAAGSLQGIGDSVTSVDFDQDGFLDILIANGFSMGRSLGLASDAGGYHLYRNRSNDNHWLSLDLEGVQSNRDGIGALVTLTSGGITQTRVQDGGIHNRGQNEQHLHFGLGKNQQVDKLSIYWPSGQEQHLYNLDSRQRLRIVEPVE